MSELLISLIFLFALGGFIWAIYIKRDVFHPLFYLMPMVVYLYVYYPILLSAQGSLPLLFSSAELEIVHFLNFLGVIALVLGCIKGSAKTKKMKNIGVWDEDNPIISARLRNIGRLFAAIAILTWVYNVSNVGGFYSAYSGPKGGGTATTGYLRDFIALGIPAIALLILGNKNKWQKKDIFLIGAITVIYLLHGLLATRRGPTFNILMALAASWYIIKSRRPKNIVAISGLIVGGFLLLFLVTFRFDIHLGADLSFIEGQSSRQIGERIREQIISSKYGNEFVYGSNVILSSRESGNHYWGKRYFATIFIRPIPSMFWPNKYQDIGLSEILVNAGLPDSATSTVRILGAAPGFMADLYKEFSWGAVLASYLFGWFLAWFWRLAVTRRGIWIVFYVCSASMSIHLILQTSIQFIYKFSLVCIPTYIIGAFYIHRSVKLSIKKQRNYAVQLNPDLMNKEKYNE